MTLSYQVAVPLLAEAEAEARRLGHTYLAPEHLLIAVAAGKNDKSCAFLKQAGLTAERVRSAVEELLGRMRLEPEAGDRPLTLALRCQLVIADAIRFAQRRREPMLPFTSDDLLTALFGDDVALTGVVGAILGRIGLTPTMAREQFAAFGSPAT